MNRRWRILTRRVIKPRPRLEEVPRGMILWRIYENLIRRFTAPVHEEDNNRQRLLRRVFARARNGLKAQRISLRHSPTPTGFAEIVSSNSPVLHCTRIRVPYQSSPRTSNSNTRGPS